MSVLETDVAIVGCGPVGALVGNLLGQLGVRTAIFEREQTAHGDPRAFSCDDDALRIYQQAGLADRLVEDMVSCPRAEFADARGEPFAVVHFGGVDFGSGYHALNFFHQPALEAVLRAGLARFDGVSLALGHDVEAFEQDASGARLRVRDRRSGEVTRVQARYVLACDGRRSTVRRLAGIELTGSRYAEPWIAISGTVASPPPTMPLARFVCDPDRPGFVARGPMRQCRWEFKLRPGEAPEAMERPDAVARLIAPYVPPEDVAITRASIYTFENKTAARWRDGRLFLVGDAAHTMPPMMGQGLVSGLRDAVNLAWKIALVLRGAASGALLDTYEQERRAHTKAMADISVRIGHVLLARDPRLVWLRDHLFRALDRIPRVHRFIRDAEFKPPPVHAEGMMLGGRHARGGAAGTLFPQPWVHTASGERVRLDDALGRGFAVLAVGADPRRLLPPGDETLHRELDTRFFRVVPPGGAVGPDELADDRNENGHGNGHGKLAAWFGRYRAEIAVVRPDRYVFGAAPAAGAERLARALRAALGR